MKLKLMIVIIMIFALAPAAIASPRPLTQKRAEKLFRHELADRDYTLMAADGYVSVDCRRLTTKRYRCTAEWRDSGADHMTGTRGYVINYSRGTDVTTTAPDCVSGCETWDS